MTDKEQVKPELTETEKRMLRSLRFASGGDMTTEEARNQMVTEKQKIEERKKRFGSIELDAEAEKQKMLEREKRFGIPSEEEEKQKIESRKKRFETGNNNEQIIQARKERFKEQYDSNNKNNNNNNIRSRGGRRIRQRKVFRSKLRNNNNNMNKRSRRTGRPIGRKRLPMKRRIRKLARKK